MYNFRHEFSEQIEHRLVVLECATDIVRFSFVAQNSISYLDLPQQEKIHHKHENLIGLSSSSDVVVLCHPTMKCPKYVINTEEKCQKILSRERGFLYRLHLDLPKKREYSLKDDHGIENMVQDSFHHHIGKISVHPNFHFSVLSSLVKEAVKRSDQKLKLIKWLVTFDAVGETAFLNKQHAFYFTECMYPDVTDSAFVEAFLKRVKFPSWIIDNYRPELLEFFLYHLCCDKSTFLHNRAFRYELIDLCFLKRHFSNIEIALKYQDGPRIPVQQTFVWFYHDHHFDREGLSRDMLREAQKWMSPKRFYLLMQFLCIYFRRKIKSAAECLRLLWRSVPDAFFSFEEIEMALQAGMSLETIKDVYNFYSEIVGVFHERFEPRLLKHLCRSTVRRMLMESRCWIPDSIKQIDVPRELQSYLNLED